MTNRDKVIIDMMRGEAQHVVARRYRMHNEQVRRIVSEYPYKHQKPAYLGHPSPYSTHGGVVITDPIPHIDYRWSDETVGDAIC